jgi:hypothetical protein
MDDGIEVGTDEDRRHGVVWSGKAQPEIADRVDPDLEAERLRLLRHIVIRIAEFRRIARAGRTVAGSRREPTNCLDMPLYAIDIDSQLCLQFF